MTDPRWLNPAEHTSWRAFISGVSALMDALDRRMQADSELSHAYFELLVPLSEAPGRELRMSELAEATRSSRSRLSHAISRMEERGWVERRSHPSDGRGQLARLTDAGFAAVAQAAPKHVDAVREYLIDRLTPDDLAALGRIGQTMTDATAGADLPPRKN